MPELERYMLALLADLDAKLRQAVDDFDFNSYTRLLAEFANNDLSAFYFDIRKDCLYCDAPLDPKRRAYRTVLDTLFHALVRWCAPVLVFTSEEVWCMRFPDAGSVHLLEWPQIGAWGDPHLKARYEALRRGREAVSAEIEPMRREKIIGSSLEARLEYPISGMNVEPDEFAEFCIVSEVVDSPAAKVTKTDKHKCGRCWRHLPEVAEDGDLCNRCDGVVNG
jgi:isoleucyl-tRNA synthetase